MKQIHWETDKQSDNIENVEEVECVYVCVCVCV